MIFKPELVKKIRVYFNLNIYETKVWLALLEKGIASAGEIAEMSGVPRSRTYDVLESLEKEGYAIAKLGKPVKYIAVKPTTVIERIKNNALRNASEKVDTLSRLKETTEYSELEQLYKTGIMPVKQQEVSGAIKGKANVFNHLRELIESSEKEVIICASASEINEKSRMFAPLFSILGKRKIGAKIAISGDENEIKRINSKFRIKARQIPLNSRFFIVDREQALFMLAPNSGNDEELGVWVNSPFFVNSLAYLFEQAWGK